MNKELRVRNYRLRTKVLIVAFSFLFAILLFAPVHANHTEESNISSATGEFWAWNDVRGWLNFHGTDTVKVTETKIEGFAVFNNGATDDWISLDCATAPHPTSSTGLPTQNICTTQSNYFVAHDSSTGNLSGWAWNDNIGWISFCGNSTAGSTWNTNTLTWDCPTTGLLYQVNINTETGDFTDWAWNDAAGWISFNCSNNHGSGGVCGTTSDYKVKTGYEFSGVSGHIISNTFDTGIADGAAFNSVIWQGELRNGDAENRVSFQFATSNCENGADDPEDATDGNDADTTAEVCDNNIGWGGIKTSGDGAYVGPGGQSTPADIYTDVDNKSIPFVPQYHNNKRYYRYKMYIERAVGNTTSPIVRDVIINWSP